MDTIFALASAAGKAGVSVVRVSGPDALDAAGRLGAQIQRHDRKLVQLVSCDGTLIDQAFVLSFGPGRSFTGEQVVEFQTHGSPAIVAALLSELEHIGLRQAEAGEFTRRAMESGALDLSQVEGLADLIDAETESQRRQALKVFKGDLGALVEGWRVRLVRAAALIEATIDFVDEEVPVDVFPEVRKLLASVLDEVRQEARGVAIRERVRDGFEVALVGPPNAGKSTLLNRLAGREAAITSEIAGTTRDVIEVKMDLNGLPVTVLDTAGLRKGADELEEIGIERGRARALNADVRVHLSVDGQFDETLGADGLDLFVWSKSDLGVSGEGLSLSAKTAAGVEEMLDKISEYLSGQVAGAGVATRQRHEAALNSASIKLEGVLTSLDDQSLPVDLVAEDLRQSIRSLDALIGRVGVENLLDEIFSSFCIGK